MLCLTAPISCQRTKTPPRCKQSPLLSWGPNAYDGNFLHFYRGFGGINMESRRVTRLFPCSQMINLAWRSSVRPFDPQCEPGAASDPLYPLGFKNSEIPPLGSHLKMTLFGISLKSKKPSPTHTGPSVKPNPRLTSLPSYWEK